MQTRMQTHATQCASLAELVRQLCRMGGVGLTGRCSQRFLQTEWSPASASLHRHFYTKLSCLSVSMLRLWNVYDSGAVDKMEIDLDWKANKISKAQSQLKSRQREQRGRRKESKRRKCINTGLVLREHRVMSTSSTRTEYWGENMDTPPWPADWCCVSSYVSVFDPFDAWHLQLLTTELVVRCVREAGRT